MNERLDKCNNQCLIIRSDKLPGNCLPRNQDNDQHIYLVQILDVNVLEKMNSLKNNVAI